MPHGSKRRLWLFRFLAILLGCCLSAVLAEFALRIYRPFQPIGVRGGRLWLFRNRTEHYSARSEKLDRSWTVHWNSLGFRGPEPPAQFADHLTILTMGGSTTECTVQGDTATWPALLEERLDKSFQNLWLDNAGRNGHSTFGHILMLQNNVLPLKPKVILFLLGVNEMGRTDLHDESYDTGALKSFARSLAYRSNLFAWTYELSHYRRTGRKARYVTDSLPLLPRYAPLREELVERERSKHRPFQASYRMRLLTIITLCRSDGVEPVFLTQPSLFGAGTDDVTGVDLERAEFDGMSGKAYWASLELYNETLRAVAGQQKVFVIDLAREMPKSSRDFMDNVHFSNKGNRTAAGVISPHLKAWLRDRFQRFAK